MKWIQSTFEKPWQTQSVPQNRQAGAAPAATQITIGNATSEKILGFGGCFNELGYIALGKARPEIRQEVLGRLFSKEDGCAFNYCRLPIGANDYSEDWYSHNEHEGDYGMDQFSIQRDHRHLIPYIREAMAYCPEMMLFASPWSPPTWMKFPKAYNNGTLVQTPENLRAYALYFRKFVEAYASEGIRIGAVHVQNEPNSNQKFPSCIWKPSEMLHFIRDYLYPEFHSAKQDCEIWLGTIERGIDHYTEREGFKDWAGFILDDPDARKIIQGIGYQWAGKGSVQRTRMAYPDMPIVQTENECCNGKNSWSQAHYVFDLIWHFIQNGANAYVYWNMVLEPGGRSTWGWEQNAMITIDPENGNATYNPEFHVMRHLSAWTQRGARRMELQGNGCVNALAFANPDGSHVLVMQNAARTERPVDVTLADGSTKTFHLAPESFHTIKTTP